MLHGKVEINHQEIGTWTATNMRNRDDGFADYDCTIEYRGMDGYTYAAQWEIWGNHRGNGAIALAARVLGEGMTKAKRVFPVDDAAEHYRDAMAKTTKLSEADQDAIELMLRKVR